MKTFALASSTLFLIAVAAGCPAPANTGEGEGGEGEGQTAGEGEGEGAGEGEGEGIGGEGEGIGGEGEGGEGEGEGEGQAITVTAATPFTDSHTFTGTDFFEEDCYTFTADATAVYTLATDGACAGANGTPETDVDITDEAGDDFFEAAIDSPTANCGVVQGLIDAGQAVTACVFNGDNGAGTFTVTISEEPQTTIGDGGTCDPNDIAAVCDTATNANEACLFDGTQHLCAVQTTLVNVGDPCVIGATTAVCDATANLTCLDDGSGSNSTCQNPDTLRCAAPVAFGSSSGGADLFIGQATNLNSAENTCGNADGNDLVLQYTIQGDEAAVTFEALGVNSIAVRTTCIDPTTETACVSGAGGRATASGSAGTLVFVLIDADPSANEIVVQASESPILNGGDTCDTAVALPSASGTLNGNNATGFADDSNLADTGCTGFTSPGFDEFYSITIPAGQTLTASMSSSDFDASLYVVDACPFDPANNAQCLAGSDTGGADTEHVSVPNTTGSDLPVFVVADEFSSSRTGTYTLTWSVQ